MGSAAGTYAGRPDERTVRIRVHRVPRVPDRVIRNGEPLPQGNDAGWQYDAEANVLTVRFRGSIDQVQHIVAENVRGAAHF